jgi:FAD:protein FMN transferase
MRKNIILIGILFIFFISCKRAGTDYMRIGGFVQGTTYHITYQNIPKKDLQPEIESLLADFDMSLSVYQENSVISKINRNEPGVRPDRHFIKVYKKSIEVNHNTGGVFDVTVAPLINAWGFGPSEKNSIDSIEVDNLLKLVGMEKVKLSGNKLIKDHPGITFNFNAIAQGYSVDLVAEYLEKYGIRNYLVEIGGEIKAKGKNPKNDTWKIGIDKPVENNNVPGTSLQSIIQIEDHSVATSGNYRKFIEKDGKKFSHFIDPFTGYPAYSNLLSVTVVADDCMTADAYATALMIMGFDKTKKFLEENKTIEAYMVYSDDEGNFQTYATDGFMDMMLEEL